MIIQGLYTQDASMEAIIKQVFKIAPTSACVLLLGESGTGKELIANALHQQSQYAKGPFIAINCAAIPENLLESELFGFEKGAFTGAYQLTKGKIEQATGGTLFLDEVGDLPLSLQPKLLRFLQEKKVERIGGRQSIQVNVRVICATHQNLLEQIKKHQFREDLYYRLAEMPLLLPPLRARGQDVVYIANKILEGCQLNYKKSMKGFTSEAIFSLLQYAWPGNIRELKNKVQRAVILAENLWITAKELDLDSKQYPPLLSLKETREKAEKEVILKALLISRGNVTKAAELLNITRPTLYSTMEKLEMRERVVTELEV
jgi:two-component system NtrC family response regulator